MPSEFGQRVLDKIGDQQPLLISLLRQLVEAESPSSRPEMQRQARAVIASELQELGFVFHEPGPGEARHLYARPADRPRGKGLQLVLGHIDTVWPLGTVSQRPFTVDDNVIRGPGVFDMKGGIAQLIVALRAIRELDMEVPLTPVIFINGDEEIGSRTSGRYIRRLAAAAERAFVLEPAMGEHGFVKTERKGVGRFTITVFGKAAHAGLDPMAGASAILELSHVIQQLFAMNDPDRGVSVNVGTVDGGIQANVIAPHSKAVVDVRVPTVRDGEAISRAIHGLEPVVPGVRLQVEGGIGRPSMEATARNRALWLHAQELGSELGLDLDGARAGGGSDGNTASQYTATLDGLGPVGDGAHAEHEFLYVDRTLERAALLALLLCAPRVPGTIEGTAS
ncbi:MAG: M20 family metallopeptidase [Gammaproteobacteria bacterium]|nr:M20 family metallopeptidase [Gammaproteobacteria bacterium]MDH4256294.1 M20 family metallopeptidase [Gammaproteobacteria bacterium]MDH5309361.1 M20 family metallopeptidase [Gammaproteobacteria bacterium]